MKFLVHNIFAALIVVVAALEAVKVDVDKENECANAKMDICNKRVKKAFVKGGRMGLSTREIYCSSMKDLSKCIESQLQSGNLCNSDKLRKYHFVVMAYLRMDKLMSTCADDMKDKFKEKVMSQFLSVPEFNKFQEFRTLAFEEEPANVNDCAKKSHDQCITLFTGMQQQDEKNLCNGVTQFIQCYQTNKCLTSRLSITFADLIREMSAELIDAFKAHSMCEVDKTEL